MHSRIHLFKNSKVTKLFFFAPHEFTNRKDIWQSIETQYQLNSWVRLYRCTIIEGSQIMFVYHWPLLFAWIQQVLWLYINNKVTNIWWIKTEAFICEETNLYQKLIALSICWNDLSDRNRPNFQQSAKIIYLSNIKYFFYT